MTTLPIPAQRVEAPRFPIPVRRVEATRFPIPVQRVEPRSPLGETIREIEEAARSRVSQQAKLTRAAELALAGTASECCAILVRSIVEFEAELDESQEVGLRLVSFGKTVEFHVENLGHFDPSLIVFYGTTEERKPMWLIQHVSQLSFLLLAVPRFDPTRARSEMGYHAIYAELCGTGDG
jgi:hypothetical protein